MPRKLPSDPDALYLLVEPLFEPLNEPSPDFAALRTRLPAAKPTSKRLAKRTTIEEALVVEGSLVVEQGLELAEGAALVVLGDLKLAGGLFSPPEAYSLIVVGGTLELDRAHTEGDVLAFGGLRADVLWASDNDHSTYAPFLEANVYVARGGRGDVLRERRVREALVDEDVDAALQARFPGLDPRSPESIRAFVGLEPKKKRPRPKPKAGEIEALRAELEAAWALPTRREKVAALREVYKKIAKRRLAEGGELLVERLRAKREANDEWSIQDELDLLAALGRPDLLEALTTDELKGYEGWMEALLAKAREEA